MESDSCRTQSKCVELVRQDRSVRLAILGNLLFVTHTIPLPIGSLGLGLMVTLFCGLVLRGEQRRKAGKGFLFLILALLYGLIAFIVHWDNASASKVILSFMLFMSLALALKNLVERVNLRVPLLDGKDLMSVLLIVMSGVLADYFYLLINGGLAEGIRPSGFYKEPSHLAMILGPILFPLWSTVPRKKLKKVIGIGLAIFIFSPSSTFLLILASMFVFQQAAQTKTLGALFRMISRFALVLVLAVSIYNLPLANSTRTRVNDVFDFREESNLSSIAYANGWMLLGGYMEQSSGIGVGLNAMGIGNRPETSATSILAAQDMEELNAFEGSFLLSKIGSELGIFGIVIWMVTLGMTWKVCRLGIPGRELMPPINRTALFVLLSMISIQSVIRSTGYFTGTTILGLFGVMVFLSKPKKSLVPRLISSTSSPELART